MQELAESIYITSVLNPNMRKFDVVMCTEYGTSYNAYVAVGSEKIALIDANHATFTDEWLARVESVLAGRTPDYLVLNHTEPDHSGSVAACLELFPNITIVCSSAAAINIKNITNMPELEPTVVKDGDSLDLGDMTLQFITAPFLHWPDTMFTWIPEKKVAFTCDFLGAHFCEPRLFDHKIIYRSKYTKAFKEYYDAIMAPFAPWVQKGLDKLEALDADIVATSHGPVLTRGDELPQAIKHYRSWSSPTEQTGAQKIRLFYCSAYGNTKRLAEHIAKGIRSTLPQADVVSHDVEDADIGYMVRELNSADAVLIGSPTINRNALPPIWDLLTEIDCVNIAKRPIALFGSYGWSGEALPCLAEYLKAIKAEVYATQFRVKLVPSYTELLEAEEFGKAFAESLAQK